MKIHHFIFALLLIVSTKAQAAVSDANLIVPGERIGAISLGMSRNEVIEAFPQHYAIKQHSYGVEEIVFKYKSAYWDNATVDVLLLGGKVVQIATADKGHNTEDEYSVGSGMVTVERTFSDLAPKTYHFSPPGDSYAFRFNDSVDLGIAFVEWDNKLLSGPVQFIVVHSTGRAAIGIWDKLRGQTQAPPQKKPRPLQKVRMTRKQQNAATAAMNAVRRLESATKVGLTYSDYSRRLVNTQVTVDEQLRGVPSSDFKSEVQAAMKGYGTARYWWKQSIDFSRPDSDKMSNAFESMMQDMWSASAQRTRNAEGLLR